MRTGHHILEWNGRLGNLLFQAAMGVALEGRTGLSWVGWGELTPALVTQLESWIGPVGRALPEEVAALQGTKSLSGKIWRLWQRIGPVSSRRWVMQRSCQTEPWHRRVMGPCYWAGYWQTPLAWIDQSPVVREQFRFRGELPGTFDDLVSLSDSADSIAMHVRRGDYVESQTFGALGLEYYHRALSRLPADAKVLIFTDDAAWCREAFPGDRYTISRGDPAQDLYLMTLCHHHIISRSTFSWWGAWLKTRPEGIVFAPETWFPSFEGIPPAQEIYPDHWTLIPVSQGSL